MKTIEIEIPDGKRVEWKEINGENVLVLVDEEKRWRDDEDKEITGYYIDNGNVVKFNGTGEPLCNTKNNYDVFATEKYAKSALAMARISQIMEHDERFGGVVTDEEWEDNETPKYVLQRDMNSMEEQINYFGYQFIAFHTEEQLNLFMKENEDLIKDYLMLD